MHTPSKLAVLASLSIASLSMSWSAYAADYALSPDGSAVVRLTSQATIGAGTLSSGLLPSGWTSTSGSGGSLAVTTYRAGFSGATGGGEIEALFNLGGAAPAGSYLEWVQVLNTNAPLGGNTSPYLDNAANTAKPFYSLTAANTTPGLPAGQLNFYDFSKRNPSLLSLTNPITWNAQLYPVVANAQQQLTVYDGVSWGWTMKKAMVGSTTATFTDPAPGSAVVGGVGSSNFGWGSGSPSSLSFAGSTFDATPNTAFKLGTLTFHNGTINSDSGADAVTFNTKLHFDNVPEKDFTLSSVLSLINTPNTSDPQASADQVSLGGWGFTFNVVEGATASVDVMATLSTGLTPSSAGTQSGAALAGANPLEPNPSYTLKIVGLANPTQGGFVTSVPEVQAWALFPAGLLVVALGARGRRGHSCSHSRGISVVRG